MALPFKYNLRNIFVRRISTALTVVSIGLVVAVFLALMSLATGLEKTFTASGDPRNVLVIRKSSQVEGQSIVTRGEYQVVRYLPGIDSGSSGAPLVSPEVIVLLNIPRLDAGGNSNVMVRGVGPEGFELRPGLRIVEGRLFRPGFREMIVSANIGGRFENGAVGSRMKFGKGMWTVVGHFDAGGTAFDSEIWTDVNELLSEFDRHGHSSILFRASDDAARSRLMEQIGEDRRLQLEARSERGYYESQTAAGSGIRAIASILTIFMGIGACFAAMNTMYAAVSGRAREIGTLRALGFSRGGILLSFMTEAVLLALIGGIVGALLALPVNGITTGSTNFSTFSEVTYNFRITLPLVFVGLLLSSVLGVIGGWFPARDAARKPIVDALRSN